MFLVPLWLCTTRVREKITTEVGAASDEMSLSYVSKQSSNEKLIMYNKSQRKDYHRSGAASDEMSLSYVSKQSSNEKLNSFRNFIITTVELTWNMATLSK